MQGNLLTFEGYFKLCGDIFSLVYH